MAKTGIRNRNLLDTNGQLRHTAGGAHIGKK